MLSGSLSSVLAGMSSVGLFASRAFVSAFAIAALLKWGPQIDAVNNTGLLRGITHVPSWFTHDLTLTILGLLAALEIAAEKSPDARALMQEVDGYLKSGVAFLTTLTAHGILTHQDADVIREITAWQEPMQAGLGDWAVGFVIASFTSVGVWFACIARRGVLGTLADADPGDNTMIVGTLSWLEDLWVLLGALLLILFPLVMLGLTALLLGGLALLHRRAMKREAQSKTPCLSCGEAMYRCAMACPACKAPNPAVRGIGWLGRTLDEPASDTARHPVVLVQKQRCPVCATHLKPRQVCQACEGCGHALFADQDEAEAYLQALDRRLPMVLLVTAGLSLIPIIGLIPAIMVYRLKLVAPLRRYTAMLGTMGTRWGLRLLFLVLVWVQVLPVIGAAAVPVMALLSYGSYRRLFMRQWARARERAR